MDEQFVEALGEALQNRKEDFEARTLAKMKDYFQNLFGSYQAFYNVLLRKSLIDEDPYKYDEKISDVKVPSTKPFMESEKSQQMSVRLSALHSQFEFLTQYFQFSLEFLTTKRLKALAELLQYIKWDNISESSNILMSRIIFDMFQRIKGGNDNLSTSILQDSINQMAKITREILVILRDLNNFIRETWKHEFRIEVLSQVQVDPANYRVQLDDLMRKFKKLVSSNMPGKPFYGALAEEVLDEEYSVQAAELKEQVMKKIAIQKTTQKKKTIDEDNKLFLLEGFRLLGGCSSALDDVAKKLSENLQLLELRKLSFGEKIAKWFKQALGKDNRQMIMDIEVQNQTTGISKHEKLNFHDFIERVLKKSRVISGMSNKNSATYQKLTNSDEDRLLKYLNTQIEEISYLHRRFPGIELYFKSEANREQRSKLRSVQIEANLIKNTIVKVNQKRHDFVSRQEERDQLKRLGIED
jgi:hypothetical protein